MPGMAFFCNGDHRIFADKEQGASNRIAGKIHSRKGGSQQDPEETDMIQSKECSVIKVLPDFDDRCKKKYVKGKKLRSSGEKHPDETAKQDHHQNVPHIRANEVIVNEQRDANFSKHKYEKQYSVNQAAPVTGIQWVPSPQVDYIIL